MDPKGALRWIDPAWWLVYPAACFVDAMARGEVAGLYPYPFIDAAKLGYATTLITAAVMLAVVLALGLSIVALHRLMGRRRAR